jgi:hypothetical protein
MPPGAAFSGLGMPQPQPQGGFGGMGMGMGGPMGGFPQQQPFGGAPRPQQPQPSAADYNPFA